MTEAARSTGFGLNDCLVTGNLVSSAAALLAGQPLGPLNFADLCNLIEITVLHERIIVATGSSNSGAHHPFEGSPLEAIVAGGFAKSVVDQAGRLGDGSVRHLLARIEETCEAAAFGSHIFGHDLVSLPSYKALAAKARGFGEAQAFARMMVGALALRMDDKNSNFSENMRDPSSRDHALFADVTRALRILDGESYEDVYSGSAFGKGSLRLLLESRKNYEVFGKYVDSVFEAAQELHIAAYAGAADTPFAVRNAIASIPQLLRDRLGSITKEINDFARNAGYQVYNIPPFALIVLSRCRRRDDIVPELLKSREEFASFRRTCTEYASNVDAAINSGTNEDVFKLHNELDRAIEALTKKANAVGFDTRLLYRVWNVAMAAGSALFAANPLAPLASIGLKVLDEWKNHDVERQALRRFNGLQDVWHKLKRGSTYQRILHSELFPNEYQGRMFAAYDELHATLQHYMRLPTGNR
jgi:hypothetical protein